MIAYTVKCTFRDSDTAEEWVSWLRDEHLAEVIASGALDAEVIRLDRDLNATLVKCEVRYHFASREAFEDYERSHAPRLRAAGLAKFGPERGLHYERSLGDVALRQAGLK